MKRIFIIYIFFFLLGQFNLNAQRLTSDSSIAGNDLMDRNTDHLDTDSAGSRIDPSTVPIDLYMWNVDERLGNVFHIKVDTTMHHFQNEVFTDGKNGEYNFLGNMGSPRQTRIFFNRPDFSSFIFLEPYSSFIVQPQNFKFTNTKSPYTNLTYHKGGDKRNGEERFNAYFAINANKKLGFGFNIDYWYGRGMYAGQSTSLFNGSLFSSYHSDRYNLHFIFSSNTIKISENGGITDDRYITDPLEMAEGKKELASNYIPTNLSNTWNETKNIQLFLTHRYKIGFHRKVNKGETPKEEMPTPETVETIKTPEENIDSLALNTVGSIVATDSTTVPKQQADAPKEVGELEFVPVTSFIHTLNLQRNSRSFIEHYIDNDTKTAYYQNNYLPADSVNDRTKNLSVKNTLGISLEEGFSKWAKAGLTAFITHELRNFTLTDTIGSNTRKYEKKYTENNVIVGGVFAKQQGHTLHYDFSGDFVLAGEDIGQFNLNGKIDLNFNLFKDTVRLDAKAYIKNLNPSFYFRNFHSNHYWWDNNDLDKEFRTRVEGQLSIDRWKTQLKVGVENIKNYTYFANANQKIVTPGKEGEESTISFKDNLKVAQASENIQVFSAGLKQDFKLGVFHLDNEITYQKSSNNTVLPLPELNLYHNFYLQAKLAKKVLSIQLGADVRYFTKYYAPAYSPVIGQFSQQNQENLVEIGGYPIVNVYANLHLKRTRIYVMMSHINEGSGNSRYFLAPHYPINPMMFRLGLSWNFFD